MCVCVPFECGALSVIQLVGVGLLEELHDGGATDVRGNHESRFATLCMRGKRMEDGVSERQKREPEGCLRGEHGLGCV